VLLNDADKASIMNLHHFKEYARFGGTESTDPRHENG